MKVTKSYLKQIIKEELEHMEEVEIPFSTIGKRPGLSSNLSGPEALGDAVSQSMFSTIYALKHFIKDPEFAELKGGYYKQRAEELIDQLEGSHEGLRSTHLRSTNSN